MSDIPRELKATAVRAITAFDKDYLAEGGAHELEHQLSEAKDGLAARIYRLAIAARRKAKNLEQTQVLFKDACAFAETRYKQQHGIANVAERIPSWSQFKSRILRAMRHGLDPSKYRSERMLREALGKVLSGKGAGPPKEGAGGGHAGPADVDAWLETTGVHSAIRVTLSRLVVAAEYIKPASRAKAEAILVAAAAELSKLVDQRKITGDATRAALDAAREAA
jgi:hypothetical protein